MFRFITLMILGMSAGNLAGSATGSLLMAGLTSFTVTLLLSILWSPQ